MKKTKPPVIVGGRDLYILISWASYGVMRSMGGSYAKDILRIIEQYAPLCGYKRDKNLKFGTNVD